MLRVNNLTGFGGGDSRPAVAFVASANRANTAGAVNTHTYGSYTPTAGNAVFVLVSWEDSSTTAVSIIGGGASDIGGEQLFKLVELQLDIGGTRQIGCAILGALAPAGGAVEIVFNTPIDDSHCDILEMSNVASLTALDTDSDDDAGGAASLAALASPGGKGVRLAAYANDTDGTAVTWTNATEIGDADAGTFRQSSAYALGASSSTITADGAADDEVIVGVSLR